MRVLPQRTQIVYPLVTLAIVLVGWQLLSESFTTVPSITSVAQAFSVLSSKTTQYGTGGYVADAVITTLRTFTIGFIISMGLGVAIGLLLGYFNRVGKWFDPYITVFYSIPRIVFIPIIIMWFGIGELARVIVVLLASIFPIILNTMSGVRNVDTSFLEVGRSFMLDQKQALAKIILPGSLAFIISGLRMGVARALIGALVAEMFLIAVGMGGAIKVFTNRLAIAQVFVFVIIIALTGITMTEAVKAVERHYSRWKVW
jgi:ABC-type nitrate/sulfonate/bicarbonate transport system permease component